MGKRREAHGDGRGKLEVRDGVVGPPLVRGEHGLLETVVNHPVVIQELSHVVPKNGSIRKVNNKGKETIILGQMIRKGE